jgi:hypothetical protein
MTIIWFPCHVGRRVVGEPQLGGEAAPRAFAGSCKRFRQGHPLARGPDQDRVTER